MVAGRLSAAAGRCLLRPQQLRRVAKRLLRHPSPEMLAGVIVCLLDQASKWIRPVRSEQVSTGVFRCVAEGGAN